MKRAGTMIAILLAACGGDDGGGGGNADAAIDSPGSGSPIPKIGTWSYSNVTPTMNTCGSAVGNQIQPGGTFAIDMANASTFHIVPGDGTAPFTCNLTGGGAFSCPNRAAGMHDFNPGFDAVITYMATAAGTFSSTILGMGTQNGTVTCTGAACAATGTTFPCTFNVSFVISSQ